MKNVEMGWACSTHWRDEVCLKFWSQKPDGKYPLGNSDGGGRLTLRWILTKCVDGKNGVH